MPDICYCGNENLDEYSEHYYVCNCCHTLVSKVDFNADLYKVKNEDSDLYGKNYWQKMMEDMVGQTSLDGVIDHYIEGRVIYWMEYILKYIPLEYKVAEIGCGLGQLAYVMKTMGYEQMAYELSPDICEYIKKTLGVNIQCGEFQDSDGSYDAVVAFDLFEHLIQPKEFLKNVYDRLSSNGVLCLQTPLYDNQLSYDEMREKKPRFLEQLKELEHLYLYSKESIKELLIQIGFHDIVFEPACFGDDYDMFLFAAKQKLDPISDAEIDRRLNHIPAGRIMKALSHLYENNKNFQSKLHVIEEDSNLRLKNIETLERSLEESEKDRAERLKVIETLERRLEESEKDRAERLKVIIEYESRLKTMDETCNRLNGELGMLQKQLEEKNNSVLSLQRMLDAYWKVMDRTKKR